MSFPIQTVIWLVVWTVFYFSIQLGMEKSSQLTFTPSFFRGVGLNQQPDKILTIINHILTIINHILTIY